MKTKKLEYRMYGLVPYNISPIQQGIQFGHGVVEYMNKHKKTSELKKWSKKDKTFIILNGGTTNLKNKGTMNEHLEELKENNVPLSVFHEPDLGDQLTSINFLVDERVWNREKYPDYVDDGFSVPYSEWFDFIGGSRNTFLREFLGDFRLA